MLASKTTSVNDEKSIRLDFKIEQRTTKVSRFWHQYRLQFLCFMIAWTLIELFLIRNTFTDNHDCRYSWRPYRDFIENPTRRSEILAIIFFSILTSPPFFLVLMLTLLLLVVENCLKSFLPSTADFFTRFAVCICSSILLVFYLFYPSLQFEEAFIYLNIYDCHQKKEIMKDPSINK
ncbi:unnamed protein product, partial [Mesorhabditis belari]|uniref:Uncharacterized protein n=1 Tax=Mesorhabditis belari TaxID=2138241 RepID=A0AAF3J373_9BILA